MKTVSSTQNPLVKEVVQLRDKSRSRKNKDLFIIEGRKELSLAIKSGYVIRQLLFYPHLFSESEARSMELYGIEIIEVTEAVFKKIAYRGTTEGVIGVVEGKRHRLEDLIFTDKNPLILVAEAPEKPGNIGALLRTADAANLDAVIISNPLTDLYNPNVIRSSVGCVFTNQIAMASTEDTIAFLQLYNFSIYAAILQESVPYHSQSYLEPTALVVGTEAQGLSQLWRTVSKTNIKIPMSGAIDSMNVSVAAGILIFEAKRQRDFK